MFTPQSIADALQVEVRRLALAALNEPEPLLAVDATVAQLQVALQFPDDPGHPFSAVCDLLRRGHRDGATNSQLRLVVGHAWTAALTAANFAGPIHNLQRVA